MAGEAKEQLLQDTSPMKVLNCYRDGRVWLAPFVFRKAKKWFFLLEKFIHFSKFTKNNLISATCNDLINWNYEILTSVTIIKPVTTDGSSIVGDFKSIVGNCYYQQ